MGNSLRDELLKVGLVSQQRPEKRRRPKRGKARPANKREEPPARPAVDQAGVTGGHVLRENRRRTARFVRDPTLGGGSVAESAKKALRRKIQQLVQSERLNDAQADVAYHFVKGKRIKRIYVTTAQRAQLEAGSIVIAALEGNHHLLTRQACEQLLSLAPQTVVCGGASSSEADDHEHPVPDDITW